MKIYINLADDVYITDDGTDGRKKCKLDYIWIGPDEGPTIGYLNGAKLKKLYKMIGRVLERGKKK
jgi:hypothetical protein